MKYEIYFVPKTTSVDFIENELFLDKHVFPKLKFSTEVFDYIIDSFEWVSSMGPDGTIYAGFNDSDLSIVDSSEFGTILYFCKAWLAIIATLSETVYYTPSRIVTSISNGGTEVLSAMSFQRNEGMAEIRQWIDLIRHCENSLMVIGSVY